MNDVPRGEWGFQGAIKAGLDLEMPGPCDGNDEKIVQAVREGRPDEAQVDACAARMVELALRVARNTKTTYNQPTTSWPDGPPRRARCCCVGAKLAAIRDFARHPRYQGADSSKINPTQLTSLCDALDARGVKYKYAHGFEVEGGVDEALIAQAVQTTRGADAVVVMLGLPDSFESEGFDRVHMDLPENQNRMMGSLVKTGTPIVAVLLPWREQMDSILLMYLGGQNSGSAMADLLVSNTNPCGKLAAGAGGHPLPWIFWKRRQCGVPGERLCGLSLL